MTEAPKGTFNIARHGDINGTVSVVPLECESNILFASPILGDLVMLLETIHEMFGIGTFGIFDAKIVYNEGKLDVTRLVPPESRSDENRGVSMRFKEALQLVIC